MLAATAANDCLGLDCAGIHGTGDPLSCSVAEIDIFEANQHEIDEFFG